MLKLFYDNVLFIYCLFLVFISGLFLGFEIDTMKHDSEIRQANKVIQNCNKLVAKGMYE